MNIQPYTFWIPVQLLACILYLPYIVIGKLLALIMVPLGMLLDWPRWCQPWGNVANNGQYADHWWYFRKHWSWKISEAFAEFWWRAIRNGFSNGARYTFANAEPGDVWRHPKSHSGFYKGPLRWAFPGDPNPPASCFQYEYDTRRPWLARFTYTRFEVLPERYFLFYIGFKFDRQEGFGFSARCSIYRNEDNMI